MGSLIRPNGLRSSMTVELRGIQQKMAHTTYPMSVRYMPPPSIQLTLQSLYPIGSTKPFKGQPLALLPSLMQSRLQTTGDLKLTSCVSEPSMSALSPTRPNSTALMVNSKVPSSPKTSAEEGWNACDFPSGFHIWQESHCF